MTNVPAQPTRSRGRSDHEVRTQIVDAATEHFGRYGYEKTTVSDLARTIGFSKAYIYKFFDSKQAIGEVICENCLVAIIAAVNGAVTGSTSASDRFRRTFRALAVAGSQLFFEDRKLYDIASVAAAETWPGVRRYETQVQDMLAQILREGREAGEFERKTPLDETVNAIYLVVSPYVNPLLLQYNLEHTDEAVMHLSNLVLRSLAP